MRAEIAIAAIALTAIVVAAVVSGGVLGSYAPSPAPPPASLGARATTVVSAVTPGVGRAVVQTDGTRRARTLAVLNGARVRRLLSAFAVPLQRPARSALPTSPTILRVRAQYSMEDTWDGYPAVRVGQRLVPHPLFGVYLLRGYLSLYERHPTIEMRHAIRIVARRSVARMELFHGGLVFRYAPGLPSPWSGERLYSGLTQAYYAVELLRAFHVTGDVLLRDAAELSFRSLLVSVEEGGVLYRWPHGVAIAETPWRPRDLTLNGWASALVSIHTYAQLSGSHEAIELFLTSVRTLASLLPLYRAPAYRNSRYKLTGPIRARLEIVGDRGTVRFTSLRVRIRGDGYFNVTPRPADRLRSTVGPHDVVATPRGLVPVGTSLRLELNLSRVSYPTPNELRASIVAGRPVQLRLEVLEGTYDPLMPSAVPGRWHLASMATVPAGSRDVSLVIPWAYADLASYLTTFRTRYDGRRTNIYHATHISRLDQLYAVTDIAALKRQADEWRADVCAWSRMPLYAQLSVMKGARSVSPVEYCSS